MRPSFAEVRDVILINLLPHREAARKRRKETFTATLAAAALAGGLVGGGVYLFYEAQIASQQARNAVLLAENKRLDGQISDIANLQSEIAALRARQQAVEDLQADRNLPVHLLNELVRQLPDGVYLTSMVQEGQRITLKGVAQSNERVSELLRNLSTGRTPWLARPELIEIVASTVSLSARDQRRTSNFTMRATLLRTSEAQKALEAAAAAPATAASAVVAVAAPGAAAARASAPVAKP